MVLSMLLIFPTLTDTKTMSPKDKQVIDQTDTACSLQQAKTNCDTWSVKLLVALIRNASRITVKTPNASTLSPSDARMKPV